MPTRKGVCLEKEADHDGTERRIPPLNRHSRDRRRPSGYARLRESARLEVIRKPSRTTAAWTENMVIGEEKYLRPISSMELR